MHAVPPITLWSNVILSKFIIGGLRHFIAAIVIMIACTSCVKSNLDETTRTRVFVADSAAIRWGGLGTSMGPSFLSVFRSHHPLALSSGWLTRALGARGPLNAVTRRPAHQIERPDVVTISVTRSMSSAEKNQFSLRNAIRSHPLRTAGFFTTERPHADDCPAERPGSSSFSSPSSPAFHLRSRESP